VLGHYGVNHKVASAYNPQTNGQEKVSNREIKKILGETMASSRKDMSIKLNEALRTYRTTYKTPIGISPFQLIYGKACHLLMELEYKVYWPLKTLNLDAKAVGEKRKLQIQELEEMRLNAYSSSKIYKERTKKYHDKKIVERNFHPGQSVLLFNSRLRLFLGSENLIGQAFML